MAATSKVCTCLRHNNPMAITPGSSSSPTTPFTSHQSMLHTGGWPADRQVLCAGEDASQVCRALRLSPLILLQPAPACSPESFFRRWEGLGNGEPLRSCSDVLKQHLQTLGLLSGQSMHASRAVVEHN